MMDSYCTVMRATIGQDTAGGTTQTFDQTVNSNLPCSCSQMSAFTQAQYAQRGMMANATVYFLKDPGVQVNDILLVRNKRTKIVNQYNAETNSRSDTHMMLWVVQAVLVEAPTSSKQVD